MNWCQMDSHFPKTAWHEFPFKLSILRCQRFRWLYDDGGLTLLLPHILKTRKQFKHCKLRVFKLANHNDQLDMETRNMASMLSRFRCS